MKNQGMVRNLWGKLSTRKSLVHWARFLCEISALFTKKSSAQKLSIAVYLSFLIK
jgi:hypothetical protein